MSSEVRNTLFLNKSLLIIALFCTSTPASQLYQSLVLNAEERDCTKTFLLTTIINTALGLPVTSVSAVQTRYLGVVSMCSF